MKVILFLSILISMSVQAEVLTNKYGKYNSIHSKEEIEAHRIAYGDEYQGYNELVDDKQDYEIRLAGIYFEMTPKELQLLVDKCWIKEIDECFLY